MAIELESLNLGEAERRLCEEALRRAGSIVDAANLLGITRHALKRRILKYRIEWPQSHRSMSDASNTRSGRGFVSMPG